MCQAAVCTFKYDFLASLNHARKKNIQDTMRSLQINSVAQVALSRLTMKIVMRTIVMVLVFGFTMLRPGFHLACTCY